MQKVVSSGRGVTKRVTASYWGRQEEQQRDSHKCDAEQDERGDA